MIKTLRITGLIAAVFAGIIFILPLVFGVHSDQEVEQLLNSPSVIDKFKLAQRDTEEAGESQDSPLVEQAQAFARYLNPPVQPRLDTAGTAPSTDVVRPRVTSSKFKLLGTSVHAAQPALSLAFIDEPGKGLHWAKQGSEVGHLIIEQVKEDHVVVRDGQRTFEQQVQEKFGPMDLLQGSRPAGSRAASRPSPETVSTDVRKPETGVPSHEPPQPEVDEQERAALTELVDRLRRIQSKVGSDKTDAAASPEDSAALMDKLISDFKATHIDAQEAKKLGDLGKELNGAQSAVGEPGPAEKKRARRITRPPVPRPPRRRISDNAAREKAAESEDQ
jgi:hypothetical protein